MNRDPQEPIEVLPAFLKTPPKNNDPKELKRKGIDDKAKAIREENDIRAVLGLEPGIRFIARLLGEICFIDQSAFHPNNSTMCNVAGRRQVGQIVKDLIRDADFELWVRVDRELDRSKSRKP